MKSVVDFKIAYNKTLKNEGGYANNPKDRGGETYKGIARKFHPNWKGWEYIDCYKNLHPNFTAKDINKHCSVHYIEELVMKFYKENFWDVLCLDKCFSQTLANEIFDDGVNRGTGAAKKTLCNIIGIRTNTKMENVILKYNEIWVKKQVKSIS